MQAIILAAGMGKRLKELTKSNTKCMVHVNGVTLIERMLGQLDRLGLSRIILVVGYEGQKLMDYVNSLEIHTSIVYVGNSVYDKTNNIYSLFLAREYLKEEDTLLLESDLIFEDSVLECLLQDQRDTLALVDKYENWMDGTVLKIDEEDNILDFIGGKKVQFREKESYYKTVNIYKFSKDFSNHYYIPFLKAYLEALGNNEYYEQVLKVITLLDDPAIRAKKLDGQLWYEIDDIQDLDIAESLFDRSEKDRLKRMQDRYGGYWRYPHVLDYCYLVNPFFPPQRMLEEMKSSFDLLLSQYPSGMAVNSLLAAKNFGVRQEYIVTGNGAAELIKAVMERESGKVGIIRPTFEEYFNRYEEKKCVIFDTSARDFQYNEEDVMEYFEGKDLALLVLINPDNPSGNYISKSGVLRLCRWAKERKIRLLLDESFADFAEEEDNTLIQNEILEEYPDLLVMKSISKSYGVPGLRIGVLASGDKQRMDELKKEVAIWNMNSFAEFYMQIAEKYREDYREAIHKVKETRGKLSHVLAGLQGLKVYPSQGNYLMCGIRNGVSSMELAERLLADSNILIKDLTDKIGNGGQYVRIAVRNGEDNDKLFRAMQKLFRGGQRENKE